MEFGVEGRDGMGLFTYTDEGAGTGRADMLVMHIAMTMVVMEVKCIVKV